MTRGQASPSTRRWSLSSIELELDGVLVSRRIEPERLGVVLDKESREELLIERRAFVMTRGFRASYGSVDSFKFS